jgi:tetratricopeptide (TPR) repeat protein
MFLRRTIAAGALLFTVVYTYAAAPDSLVRWNEITFSSPFEQQAFNGFLKKKGNDYVSVFLGNAPEADKYLGFFNEKINVTLKEIETSGALKKRNDKKVKAVYQEVHDRFLSKYELENRFYEIMSKGNYNCVTATALYAFFFEKLGIPYNIMERPTHVYLVAYPDAENIMVETTTPMFGFTTYNPDFKASYVSTLKKQKIIGGEEAVGSNVDELFNKYFFGTENISLTELVGIHYMNDGIYRRDKEDYKGAYEQMMKAYLFYPCPKSEFLLMSFGAILLDQKTTDPVTKAALIGRLSRFDNVGIDLEAIQGEFQRLTQQVLGKTNDRELYAKCYEAMMANVSNPEIANELKYIYNYENGRIYYNQGNYVKAKPFFAAALQAQPRNAELSGPFIACLGQSLRNERRNRAVVDTLESYRSRFPVLDEYPNFLTMLGLSYAGIFGDAYAKNDPVEGEKYKKLFEDLYEKGSMNIVSQDIIGKAYSEAAVYYFRKGQKTKARTVIDRGLEIVPGDYQLKMRKQMIGGN